MYTDYRGFHGFLIIKVCSQISPGIYLHALMDSLVSRERVQNILQAEPIRNLAELTPSQEKALETPIPVLHSNQNHLDSKFSQPSSFPKPELRWVLGINDHSHSHSPPPSSSSSSSPVGTLMNPPPTSNNLDKPTNKDVNSIIDQNHLPNVDIPWAGTYKEDDLQCLNFENIKGERERDTFPTSSTEIRRSSTGLELRRVSQIYKCKGKDLEKGIGIGKEEGTIESGMVGLEDWDRSRRSSYLYALNDALARGPLPGFP
ncbi:hypothetical protein TREMEDRAFT_56342 [Tremella mesenterica DSM 1558]|uniref:uncharacterized protein n=1 Tax=Tremella mesenterica (strain ATCC 24925 / CBS 8224 / DSM 1558 / NBRC 9311 / NRRL Y-6157 / RJB 2259-6 / UBC 559-6) TaxID=578456 RepID=UPI0003F49357|nr:uncharacterized protein TREMEDRAFT_56342 [Tremella mesenterica DSM 1558]EIW71169.1 hypothetical protein TREMEDRAFT_56342 [Tremella mesenterica DSM 1558]